MANPRRSHKEQLQKFQEAARELGADMSEEEFDKVLRKVASSPPAPAPKEEKGDKPKPKKPGR